MIGRSALLLAAALAVAALPAAADPMVMGVRTDARPFAWQADDNALTFRGYLVDLCVAAVIRAGYRFVQVPVSATQRQAVLDGAFTVDGQDLDLLCDPTTISLQRLDRLGAAADFSPIVFVANGAFVKHARFENRGPCRIGATDETRATCARVSADPDGASGTEPKVETVVAPPGLDCAPAIKPETKEAAYYVAALVAGTTAENTLERAQRLRQIGLKPGESICTAVVPDHREGVRRFCANEFHYYFGDLDIIEAYRDLVLDGGGGCDLARGERPLSYEPYALLVPSANAEFRARFVTAVYEVFSDGTADGLFDAYFPDHSKSAALDMLFRINRIPGLRPGKPVAPPALQASHTR